MRTTLLVLIAAAGALVCTPAAAQTCDSRLATRATSPGPHDYSLGVESERLWQEGEPGEPLFLRARVLDNCAQPVAGARVRILHANQDGGHQADRWRADLRTDGQGAFKLITVFPGYTGGIARHIHFDISHPEHPRLVTRLFFKNDPHIDHGVDDLAMVLEEIQRGGRRGWLASYEFVLPR